MRAVIGCDRSATARPNQQRSAWHILGMSVYLLIAPMQAVFPRCRNEFGAPQHVAKKIRPHVPPGCPENAGETQKRPRPKEGCARQRGPTPACRPARYSPKNAPTPKAIRGRKHHPREDRAGPDPQVAPESGMSAPDPRRSARAERQRHRRLSPQVSSVPPWTTRVSPATQSRTTPRRGASGTIMVGSKGGKDGRWSGACVCAHASANPAFHRRRSKDWVLFPIGNIYPLRRAALTPLSPRPSPTSGRGGSSAKVRLRPLCAAPANPPAPPPSQPAPRLPRGRGR